MVTFRGRLKAVEERLAVRAEKTIVITWPTADEAKTRARVEMARRRGWKLRVIHFVVRPMSVGDEHPFSPEPLPEWLSSPRADR